MGKLEINRRFSENVRKEMRRQIQEADGNEVFFAGKINEEGVVVTVVAAARGNTNSVPVNYSESRKCSVLIHNHPSGNLHPSSADLSIASDCSENAQGFYIVNNDVTEVYAVMEPILPVVIKKLNPEDTAFYLTARGPFARKSENYEERPVQISLVKKITECFNENKIGVFEAGTGVGKSYSYLIPSILWAEENKERVVISTGTINLQQQIIEKDIPGAEKILNKKIKAVLVKGRQNYICLRRLEETGKERDLFSEEQETFDKLYEWSKNTKTGNKSDLSFMPPENVWQKVNSEADACMGMKCPFREKCFVMKVRKEAADANLLVVNHHILFADIESRLEGAGYDDTAVLPPYKRIIFDEAHGIEDAATSFFSGQFNRFKILKQLNLMYRTRRGSAAGFIFSLLSLVTAEDNSTDLIENINQIKVALEDMEQSALELMQNEYTLRLYSQNSALFVNMLHYMSILQKHLVEFTGNVRKLFDYVSDELSDSPVIYESKSVLRRLEDAAAMLTNFLAWAEHPECVFWIQKTRLSANAAKGFENPYYIQFYQTPLDIAQTMNKGVYEPMDSVVCTSATLSIGASFNYWKKRTGVSFAEKERVLEGSFPSPFPYTTNVVFAVTKDAPFPENAVEFQRYAEDAIVKLIRAAGGKTLVLFTSYDSLRHACDTARTALKMTGLKILKQGDDDRFRLLNLFKEDTSSVLFATQSFWEGVDVPGDSLSQVIIVKLPFGVPTDPVFAARSELIQKRGGSPFMELSVPDSVIKFRQGFGRLMRRSDDKGAIVVLDRRIVEKQYGRMFTSSVPETIKIYDTVDVIAGAVAGLID